MTSWVPPKTERQNPARNPVARLPPPTRRWTPATASASLGNVRKTDARLQSFAGPKANIAAIGILSNLVVRPVPGDPDRFAIVAGARRYGALTQLTAEGLHHA